MNALSAENLIFSYTDTPVIQNVTAQLNEGEFLGIIGPNGAGKSTLLRLLCAILKPDAGIVQVFEHQINSLRRTDIARMIGFVPQETHFTLNFTVEEVVSMGRFPYLRAFQRKSAHDLDAIEHALAFTEIDQFRMRSVNSLSSGEKQRVVIARALAQKPRILLLDEPTSHLDLHHQYAIMELLMRLNREGLSIAVVHHDLNLAGLYCQRLVLMNNGMVHSQGTPGTLLTLDTIAEVYRTTVTIMKHPHKDVPQIFLHPKGDNNENHQHKNNNSNKRKRRPR
jgi:iron complex transport system ATP-binding protein